MPKIILEDKVYSWAQLLQTDFDPDEYCVPNFTGTFRGTLDCKCYGRKKLSGAIILSLALEDGRKAKCTVWANHRYAWQAETRVPYMGVREISIGSAIEIEFE